MVHVFFIIFFSLITSISLTYGYDVLDPSANITITWDFLTDNEATHHVKVSIYNFQLYRHIDRPGWKLSWAWKTEEVIWDMWGAEALLQGNCSRFHGSQLPHCCEKRPVIIDLLPGTSYNLQVSNCCRGGVLSSMIQDQTKYMAAFQMKYNKITANGKNDFMPENFTIGVPGYTCGNPLQVAPSRFSKDGRRWTQVLDTWNITCIYSQFRSSPTPKCCVSLSAFYNDTIVPCPKCSCNCQGLPGTKCMEPDLTPSVLQLPKSENPIQEAPPLVRCTEHMCPIRVHWHVQQSYKEYWRIKMTITNFNFVKNYSDWNLVVLHPNLQNLTKVFSFNYKALHQYGHFNDTGMFWGIQYYNDMLLTSGKCGNVQSEILLCKDPSYFTWSGGWAFPRRISFNGDECVMPSPIDFPRLPNSANATYGLTLCIRLNSTKVGRLRKQESKQNTVCHNYLASSGSGAPLPNGSAAGMPMVGKWFLLLLSMLLWLLYKVNFLATQNSDQ